MSESVPTDPAAAVAPVAEPVVAPVVDVVVETPAVEAPATEAPAHPAETPTLLEDAGKPAEAAPPETPKPEEAAPVEPPVYQDFTFAETIKPDAEMLGEFKSMLGEKGLDQETGQKMVDLYGKAATAYATHLQAEQFRVFAETRRGWQEQIKSDEQLGGAAFQTSSAAVARARDLLVPAKDQASFNEFLRVTGAGDHPAFWRLLHNASRRFDEPAPPPPAVKPPASIGKPLGRAGNRQMIYDHPRSNSSGR